MIRKPRQPGITWAYIAFGVGVALSIGLWWYQFVETYWRLGNGSIMHVGFQNALSCLPPWDALECRRLFGDNGYGDMANVTRKQVIVAVPWMAGVAALILGAYLRWFNQPHRQVLSGPAIGDMTDLREQALQEGGEPGIEVFPGWQINRTRETTHFALLAGTGGGKTTFLMWLLTAVLERDDKVILYAEKSNFIGRCPKRNSDDPFILIGPHDRRSWIWDIAKEVIDEAAAIRIASYLVREEKGQNAYFSDAARAVVTAVLLYLRDRFGSTWTWAHLVTVSELPLEELNKTVGPHYGPARTYLRADKKLASSIQSTVQNAMLQLRFLALAWGNEKDRERISIRDFILRNDLPKTLMIGRSGDYSDMSEKWISLFFSIAADTIRSESFAPEKNDRLWFMLDELAQLPKIPRISDLLAIGREKGVPVVLGLQDMSQIRKVYGNDEVQTWFTNIGTKVYGLTRSGETQMMMSKLVGEARIREKKYVPSAGGGTYDAGNEWTEAVMQPSDFATELGSRGDYVTMLAADVGRHPCLISVEHFSLEFVRDAYREAKWIADGPKLLAEINERVQKNKQLIAEGVTNIPLSGNGVDRPTPPMPEPEPPVTPEEPLAKPEKTPDVELQVTRGEPAARPETTPEPDNEVFIHPAGLERLRKIREQRMRPPE